MGGPDAAPLGDALSPSFLSLSQTLVLLPSFPSSVQISSTTLSGHNTKHIEPATADRQRRGVLSCPPGGAVEALSPKMDASRRQSGIQQLLAAEQEAQQIVNAARAAKSARLRQAKEEAEREIAEYRAQMEADFQRKVAESSGDSGANVKRLEQETNIKIEQLKQQAASISPEVIEMLLRHVTTVKN